jgi:cell division protein FtsI (penicillin-binding protein 3)
LWLLNKGQLLKSKIISLFIFIISLWGILLARAAYLQFLPHEKLNTLQARQFQTVVTLPSRRGNIVDVNGKELAMSAPAYSIYADPKTLENRKQTAQVLAKYLTEPYAKIYSKLKDKEKRFVWIERLVASEIVDKLKERKIRGLGFVEEWRRVYPNDYLLSSTLGFVGKEGQGLEGIELALDHQLQGENKKVSLRKDAKGRPLLQDGMVFKETPQGKEVKLTIDSDLQYFVETELMQAMKKHDADGAYAVVLDAKTSAVRSIVSLPHYDLNNPQKFNSNSRRNKSVTDTYEPGSTLKAFIIADALQKKAFTSDSKIFCENGAFKIGKRTIREAEKNHAQGLITVSEVLAYSSNIGTSKIALKLGANEVQQGLKKFGFGSRSNIDMPGEAKGIMVGLPWSDHLLANVSFGQGITTTPLQMANAYAVLANGGYLNTPHIIESIVDLETNEADELKERISTKILSDDVAAQMKEMLVGVTTGKGSGLSARVPGYVVGGKTGTAQKINPAGRGYLRGGYIGSFAGFIPANDPQYVIYIAIDHPKKNGYYGAQVAAPLFASIASYAIRKDGISPAATLAENAPTPETEAVAIENAQAAHDEELKTFSDKQLRNLSAVLTSAPELKSLSLREVIQKTADKEIKLKIIGSGGRVYRTNPEAGEAFGPERNMTIYLKE